MTRLLFLRVAGGAVLFAGLAAALPVGPQSGRNLERPGHWKARYDEAAGIADRRFVVMRPGWHVFAGPGGLFWDPGRFAAGSYSVESTVYLFPEGDPEASGSTGLDSAYGLFLGGSGLEGGDAVWTGFELRNDGSFRVVEHRGGIESELVPWTASDAVATLGADSPGPVENVLTVDVRETGTAFLINGAPSAALPPDAAATEGIIGIRAGAGLSLHVTEVRIGPNRPSE